MAAFSLTLVVAKHWIKEGKQYRQNSCSRMGIFLRNLILTRHFVLLKAEIGEKKPSYLTLWVL